MERGSMRLDARRVPEDVFVTRLVHQPVDLAAELRQDVDRELLVLEPDARQAAVGPAVVDPARHQ
jgi:hypothetical protein